MFYAKQPLEEVITMSTCYNLHLIGLSYLSVYLQKCLGKYFIHRVGSANILFV